MSHQLDKIEQRVIGVLIEKSMTQPEYYPMSLNSVVVACNQKSNRDPVMDLDEGPVWDALERLRQRDIVHKILPGPGVRVERFKHNVEQTFHWQTRHRAIMAELLLRGPQTIGELRSRCARMADVGGLEDITAVLEALKGFEPPMAAPLARAPGEKAIRWTHLLDPEGAPVVVAEPPRASREERVIKLEPVGYVRSAVREPLDSGWGSREARIELEPRWAGALAGLEEFSHAVILFFMHGAPPSSHVVRHPRGRTDLPQVGVLAQRGRERPNPIGVTTVEIVGIEAAVLSVRGLDAIDGTPVLDIKPYVEQFDRPATARAPEWVAEVMRGYF